MRRGDKRSAELGHRLVWQGASLLLAMPDREHFARLETVAGMLGHLDGVLAMSMGRAIAGLQELDILSARHAHDQAFGPRSAGGLKLTRWTAGNTREQAMTTLDFTNAYRAAGVTTPRTEAHDHLVVVLEFGAHVDPAAGRRLLVEHRVPIAALGRTLTEAGSPYAHVLTAVSATLPEVAAAEIDATSSAAERAGLQQQEKVVDDR